MKVIKHRKYVNFLPESTVEKCFLKFASIFIGDYGICTGGIVLSVVFTHDIHEPDLNSKSVVDK